MKEKWPFQSSATDVTGSLGLLGRGKIGLCVTKQGFQVALQGSFPSQIKASLTFFLQTRITVDISTQYV
jgi:hypothetical protein